MHKYTIINDIFIIIIIVYLFSPVPSLLAFFKRSNKLVKVYNNGCAQIAGVVGM